MTEQERKGIEGAVAALTQAWNAGDADSFARVFTEDADFVNIFAMHLSGREAIAQQHRAIFEDIYRGTHNAFTLEDTKALADGLALAHISSRFAVPAGPLAGEMRTLASAVLVRDGSGWAIRSFHNTREQAPPIP